MMIDIERADIWYIVYETINVRLNLFKGCAAIRFVEGQMEYCLSVIRVGIIEIVALWLKTEVTQSLIDNNWLRRFHFDIFVTED